MITNSTQMNEGLKDLLVDISTPDIYRNNAFRYLDLSAFSSNREINKRKQIIEISKSNGTSIPNDLGINLFHQEVDYSTNFNHVIEKIKNPINRLVEEFFWFWPEKPDNNHHGMGLSHLINHDPEMALMTWENTSIDGDPYGIALHNATILRHIQLLESYFDTLSEGIEVDINEIKHKWEKCFRNWHGLIENEGFWSFMLSRVRDIDDPRLTTGNVRRLRSLLPLSLALIKIRFALRLAETEKIDSINGLLLNLHQQVVDQEILNEASQYAIVPEIKRLNYLSSSVLKSIDTSNIDAHMEINEALGQGIRMIKVIDITSIYRPVDEYKDQFAETLSKIAINYGYNTQNDLVAIDLLEKIKSVSKNTKIIDDVDYHIKYFKGRIVNGNYWCAEGYHSLSASLYNALEEARKCVTQKKYDEAKKLLDGLLHVNIISLKKFEIRIINTCQAYCLNMQAIEYYDNAVKLMDFVPTFVRKVADRFSYAEKEIGLANWAADNNKLTQACYEGVLQCMACGDYLFNINYVYTFKWKGLTYVGCSYCTQVYDTELKTNRSAIRTILTKVLENLDRGFKLNPNNQQIKENFDNIKPIAQSWGVNVEDYAAGEIKPKKLNNQSDFKRVYKQNIASTSNQNSSTRKKPNKEQESTSKEEVQQALWTIIFVILILAWLIFSLAY